MFKLKFLLILAVVLVSFGYISYAQEDGSSQNVSVLSTQLADKVFSVYKNTIDKQIQIGKLTSKNVSAYLKIVEKSIVINSSKYSQTVKDAAKKVFLENITKYVNDYFANDSSDVKKTPPVDSSLNTASKAKNTKLDTKIQNLVTQAKKEISAGKSKTAIGKGSSTLSFGTYGTPGSMKKELVFAPGSANPAFMILSGLNFSISDSSDIIGVYNKNSMLCAGNTNFKRNIFLFAAHGKNPDLPFPQEIKNNMGFGSSEEMGIFYYDKQSDTFYNLLGNFYLSNTHNGDFDVPTAKALWAPLNLILMTNIVLGSQIDLAINPYLTEEKVHLNGLPDSFEVGESREIYFKLMKGFDGNTYDQQYQVINGNGIVRKYPQRWNNKLRTFGFVTYEIASNDNNSVIIKVKGKSIFDNHEVSKEQNLTITRRSFANKNILYENDYFAIYMENGAMYFGTKQGEISTRISSSPYRNKTFTTNKKDFLLTDVPGSLANGKTYNVEWYTYKNENNPKNPTTVQLNKTFVISGGTAGDDAFLQFTLPSSWSNAQSIQLTYTGKKLQTNKTVEILKGSGIIVSVSTNFYYVPSIKYDNEVILKITGKSTSNVTLTDTKTINVNVPAINNPLYTNQYLTIYKTGNSLKIRKEVAKDIEVKLSWTNGGVTKKVQGHQVDAGIGNLSNYIGKTITVNEYSVKNLDGNTDWTVFPSSATFTVQ